MRDQEAEAFANTGRANHIFQAYLNIAMQNAGIPEDDQIRIEQAFLSALDTYTAEEALQENPWK